MKKLISRRKFLAAMGTMAAAGVLFHQHCFLCCRFQYGCLCCGELG